MLDERLIGMTFTITTPGVEGNIRLFGIDYHYKILDNAGVGDSVVIDRISPLTLFVRLATAPLVY